jgi:hypothetical protein
LYALLTFSNLNTTSFDVLVGHSLGSQLVDSSWLELKGINVNSTTL